MNILRQAQEDPGTLGSCPYTVDAIIMQDCAYAWKAVADQQREHLLYWEDNGGQGIPLRSIIHQSHATENMYGLSRTFEVILGDLNDFDERLTFLIDHGKRCSAMTPATLGLSESGTETLVYLRSRNRMWTRWVQNYRERTHLIMNLFFSIGSQADSRTNLEIADLTSKIAVDAQRDSSSMITIAAVTMVFLPGTFISVS
ncbi:MAG: hypothetical protein Q9170_006877 [Blastenia crenularia]